MTLSPKQYCHPSHSRYQSQSQACNSPTVRKRGWSERVQILQL